MHQITRKFTFDSGHRVWGHAGKCAHLHGHRYDIEVTLEAPDLDDLGVVVDFGVLKELFGGYIDAYWDHTMLLNTRDPLAIVWAAEQQADPSKRSGFFLPGKVPILFNDCNPTAENISAALFREFQCLIQKHPETNLKVDNFLHVRVWETEKCSAVAKGYTKYPLVMSYATGEVYAGPAESEATKARKMLTEPPAVPNKQILYIMEGMRDTGGGTMRERGIVWEPIAATFDHNAMNKAGSADLLTHGAAVKLRGKSILVLSPEDFDKAVRVFLNAPPSA